MRAVRYDQYGSAEKVLRLETLPVPVPGDNEVLVRIHAASVNPLDWHIMRADPFIARFGQGLTKPKSPRLGADLAGVVEAIGRGVTGFEVGDRVMGELGNSGLGAFADYAMAQPNELVKIADHVSFEAAAATPVAGLTALQGLRDTGKLKSGERVLVNGASGGVGSFGVQIAKAMGAHVTGVCSTLNLALVRSAGADEVIDYTAQDFATGAAHYDLIFDAVGNRSPGDLKKALTANGRAVVAGFTSLGGLFSLLVMGAWLSRGEQKIGLMPTATSKPADLLTLADYLASGAVKPIIDRRYSLEETAAAIAYLETRRARGKVILIMVPGQNENTDPLPH